MDRREQCVWITVTTGGSGTGNGTVAYTAAANTATSPRTGTLTIAGQTLTVTQSGICSFAISPNAQTAVAAGGSFTTAVTTTSGCAWTGASNASWITVTSGGSGTGNGTAAYTVGSEHRDQSAHRNADDRRANTHRHAERYL